jgi:hypothetical protein
MVRCTVAKSRTTNVGSSSSRDADRLVAVDLLLGKSLLEYTSSALYGHGISEGYTVRTGGNANPRTLFF